jgi:Mg2+ and Co2+ transporter CorA
MSAKFDIRILDHPSSSEIAESLDIFERGLVNSKIHITAREGLIGSDELALIEPFPKIESHDAYLYGVLATPTDIEDGQSKFFNVQYLISEKMALVVFWGPEEGVLSRSKDLFAKINKTAEENEDPNIEIQSEPGDIFVQISQVIVDDLQVIVSRLNETTNKETARIESALFDQTYQSMSSDATETYLKISRLKFEILSISPIISETQNVFKAISDLKVVIQAPFATGNMDTAPFSSNQRIWINDLLMRTRSLKSQRSGLEQEVRLLYERLESLENRRQTAAQMRFAAVASILLLPALIVGFFGQNFEINPWAKSSISWEVSAIALSAIALTQFIYFKKKKWF